MKKKTIFRRMFSLMTLVLSLAMVLSFTAVSASAADVPVAEITAVATDNNEAAQDDGVTIAQLFAWNPSIVAHAEGADEGDGDSTTGATAESSYNTVLTFFITWLRRIGAAVALIGGIMFGLAIKDNNADQKQAGLMTMVAGFVVVAICLASTMFDLFS